MAERVLVLTEYQLSEPIALTVEERDVLRTAVDGLSVVPEAGSDDEYRLTCGSTVGVVRVGDLTLELRPKVGLAPLLFMLGYRDNPTRWRSEPTSLAADATLSEALVDLFVRFTHAATRTGLLHSYRRQADSLTTVRGRIRMTDQMTQRRGMPLPVEVEFDEFTDDVLENQILRSAVDRLRQVRIRSEISRRSLDRLHHLLHTIAPLAGPPVEPVWTRLNNHYRPAVGLARALLAGGLEARAGGVHAAGILVDMNAVFEDFVRTALRESLGVTQREFPAGRAAPRRWLDTGRKIALEPDLTWWSGGQCVFVGDCKYKQGNSSIPNADVYQMLAYLTAYGLEEGTLIYAAGEAAVGDLRIDSAGKTVRVRTVDVSRSPEDIVQTVAGLADELNPFSDRGRAVTVVS